MPRLIVLWEHPATARPEEVDLWARGQVGKLAADAAVEKAVLTRLEQVPLGATWYGWLLELDVSASNELADARAFVDLLGELRQLRLHPLVLVAARTAHVETES